MYDPVASKALRNLLSFLRTKIRRNT
jgi:hypothetical protein